VFLRNVLSRRGLPTSHLANVTFVEGLNRNANLYTNIAYRSSNNRAVTQGSTIYVHPEYWREITTFSSYRGFEEIFHTAQFASGDFYEGYFTNAFGSLLSGSGGYPAMPEEAFAQGAAREALSEAGNFMCR
jgi:hypothetical protein